MVDEIESLINSGRYFEAHNMAEAYCAKNPNDLRAQQLCGLSMSKSGARKAAMKYLEPVLQQHSEDPETAGILGGVYKEHFKMTADSAYARKSLETYLSNFEKTKSYYTGINAATMSQILGRGRIAREVATEVIEIARKDEDFWAYATIGEANLLLRNSTEALEYYYKAAQKGGGQYGNLGSIYAQLLILKHYINVPEEIMAMFAPPKIAVFAGHMIDNDRDVPRFPDKISEQVKFAIANDLRINNIKIGYSSLACGSDILFIESLLELGGEAKIFLPFDRDDFLKTSVEFAGSDWLERFRKIEESNDITYISRRHYDDADVLFQFLGKVMIGAGIIRASFFHDRPFLLTVASETDQSKKEGGTNALRAIWPFPESLININPDLYLSPGDVATPGIKLPDKPEPFETPVLTKNIRYFVLATLLNKDDEALAGKVEDLISKVKNEFIEFPGSKRSGVREEGIFALYSKAHYAMDFALRLLGWAETNDLEVRIALEAVLMDKVSDPVKVITETSSLKSLAFSDACYATMQFAASLSAEQPGRYDFHHVGIIMVGEIDEGQEIYKIDQKVETALS
jgi:tetratricopeptide (TPR) repeat protein